MPKTVSSRVIPTPAQPPAGEAGSLRASEVLARQAELARLRDELLRMIVRNEQRRRTESEASAT